MSSSPMSLHKTLSVVALTFAGILLITPSHAQISSYLTEPSFLNVTGPLNAIEFEEVDPYIPDSASIGYMGVSDQNGEFRRAAAGASTEILFQVSPGDINQPAHGVVNLNDANYYADVFQTPYNLGSGDFGLAFSPNDTTPVTFNMLFTNSEIGLGPVYAIGFLVGDFRGNGGLTVTATNLNGAVETINLNVANPNYGFVGFVSDVALTNISITGNANPTTSIAFDHVLYSSTPISANVPAPSSVLTLLLGGVPGVCLMLRRRRQK